ncbi:hypothetical protein GF382_02490 [Candidatus Falkowbacteria bacterium]|nr:hypothetical protein [Candidatus Falkowbacteria bacterium]
MLYIIDANNLAGRLGLLEESGFDQILFDIIDEYFSRKESEAYLVFDSSDPMGDKDKRGRITVFYAPRDDKLYSNADDKILELIDKKISREDFKDEITIVSDDNGLKDKVSALAEEAEMEKKLHLLTCGDFIEKMNKAAERVNDDYFDPKDMDMEDEIKINEELRNIWN